MRFFRDKTMYWTFYVSFRCELIADSYLVDNTKEDGFPDVGERLIEEVAN